MEDEVKPEAALSQINEHNPWSSIPTSNEAPDISTEASYDPHDLPNEHEPTTQIDVKSVEPSASITDPLVLKEFDPLVVHPFTEGQEAWVDAEGHTPLGIRTDSLEANTTKEIPGTGISTTNTASQFPPTFISSIPSSLATFAKNLSISPKRSLTPPLPPPPRSSSLRHNHHSSLPTNVLPPADVATSLPPSSSAEVTQQPSTERNGNQSKSDGSFDFQKFLDQMKSRGADPIAKYLRRYKYALFNVESIENSFPISFLSNFAKRTYPVKDQIKVINDFLNVRVIVIYIDTPIKLTYSSSLLIKCAA